MEVFGGERVIKVGDSLVTVPTIRALYRDIFIGAISGKKAALRRAVELIISEFPKPPEGWKPEPAAHFDREAAWREISKQFGVEWDAERFNRKPTAAEKAESRRTQKLVDRIVRAIENNDPK